MKRREFIALIGGAAAAWPLAARTQGVNRPRVGYLFTSEKAEGQGLWEACRQGLRELGYRERSPLPRTGRLMSALGHKRT
jgi:putative ABC transport system substrate-binding protein